MSEGKSQTTVRPPQEHTEVIWHWLRHGACNYEAAAWYPYVNVWAIAGRAEKRTPQAMAADGWAYYAPAHPPEIGTSAMTDNSSTEDQDVYDLLDACKLAVVAMGAMDAARLIQSIVDVVEARRGLAEASIVSWPGKNRR